MKDVDGKKIRPWIRRTMGPVFRTIEPNGTIQAICPCSLDCPLPLDPCSHLGPHSYNINCTIPCGCPNCVTEDDLIYHVTLERVKRAKGENNDGKRL